MSDEPIWLAVDDVRRFHAAVLHRFGGPDGTRDDGLLESAVARALQVHAYGQGDVFDLAATYAHGIAKNHPFIDGNKRTAFVSARVFLGVNGIDLRPGEAEAVVAVEGLALGDITLEQFAGWLRSNSRKRRKPRKPR